MKLSCRECGAKLDIKDIEKAKNICPICKKETSWFSEPKAFGMFKNLLKK